MHFLIMDTTCQVIRNQYSNCFESRFLQMLHHFHPLAPCVRTLHPIDGAVVVQWSADTAKQEEAFAVSGNYRWSLANSIRKWRSSRPSVITKYHRPINCSFHRQVSQGRQAPSNGRTEHFFKVKITFQILQQTIPLSLTCRGSHFHR